MSSCTSFCLLFLYTCMREVCNSHATSNLNVTIWKFSSLNSLVLNSYAQPQNVGKTQPDPQFLDTKMYVSA